MFTCPLYMLCYLEAAFNWCNVLVVLLSCTKLKFEPRQCAFVFYALQVCTLLSSVELPSHWSPMDGDEHVKLVKLQATSEEYKKVASTFKSPAHQSVNNIKKGE